MEKLDQLLYLGDRLPKGRTVKKFFLHPLFPLVLLLAFDAFFIYQKSLRAASCFVENPDKKPEMASEDFISYKIWGLEKPIPIDLAHEKGVPLFMSEGERYPELLGMKDRFLADLGDEVAVLGPEGPLDALILDGVDPVVHMIGDDKKAYIAANDRLYIYNGRWFDRHMYRFDRVSDLFLDKKNLYVVMYGDLMVMDRRTETVTYRKNCTFDRNDTLLLNIQDGWAYVWQGKALKRIGMQNDAVETLFEKMDFLHHWKNYYIVQKGNRYSLYRYPQKALATFDLEKGSPIYFFVLKDHLYLIRENKIFATLDLHTKRVRRIVPVPFESLSFGVGDRHIAYIKGELVNRLDADLAPLRCDKIHILPHRFSFAADGNHTAAIYRQRIVLDGKRTLKDKRGEVYRPKYIDTYLAMEGDRTAAVGFDMNDEGKLRIDLFNGVDLINTYDLDVHGDFLHNAILYGDIVVASFYDKTVLIRKGKIVKTIDLGGKYIDQTVKRVGRRIYLSYGHNLKEIDLRTLRVEIIDSDPMTEGMRKGGNFIIERDRLTPFMLRVRFQDRNVTIADGGRIERYYALRDYAIFQTGLHSILAIAKDRAYRLRMTLEHNKILNFKPLEGNRFVVLDGLGFRTVDLDRELRKAR